MLGLSALGIYGRAYQLMAAPAVLFGQVLDEVLFPSMSKMQSDNERLASAYFRGVSLIALVMLPVSVLAVILAPEIVFCILGPAWSEVVLPFRILALGLLFRTSYKISDTLTRAKGAVYRRSWRQILYAASVILGAWAGQFWGVAGVAVGILGAVLINYLLMAQMSIQLIGGSWKCFLQAQEKAVLLAAAAASVVVPIVMVLRLAGVPSAIILSAATAASLALLFAIIKFAPNLFLGKEGIWILDHLFSYVPQTIRTRFLLEPAKRPSRSVGTGNIPVVENSGVSS
jgi:PST family polysaccharide transporter